MFSFDRAVYTQVRRIHHVLQVAELSISEAELLEKDTRDSLSAAIILLSAIDSLLFAAIITWGLGLLNFRCP